MRKNKIIIICIAAVLVIAIALTTILAVNCNGKDPTPDPTPMEAKLESISLDTSAAKIEYAFAETFTTEGLKVTAKMSDGTTKDIALSDCTIKEPDTGRAGKRTVTVSYKGKTATYKITVNKRVYPSLGQDALRRFITSWEYDYKMLKHIRWVRNQLSHEIGTLHSDICTQEDLYFVTNFYNEIMKCKDPLAQMRVLKENEEKTHSRKNTTSISKQTEQNTPINKTNKKSIFSKLLEKIKNFFS